MGKTGIFYGSTTGTTEEIANSIAQKLGISPDDVHDVRDFTREMIDQYDYLILGTSTWGDGEMQEDWLEPVEVLSQMNLTGKTIAFFGSGDSQGNSFSFCSGMGELYKKLKNTGATFVGCVPHDGYNFNHSEAIEDDRFVGLPLDEVNEGKPVTEKRVEEWTKTLNFNPRSQKLD